MQVRNSTCPPGVLTTILPNVDPAGHESAPPAPAGPVGPRCPAGPGGPAGPCGPVAPTGPRAPAGPVSPFDPCGPCAPVGPVGPPVALIVTVVCGGVAELALTATVVSTPAAPARARLVAIRRAGFDGSFNGFPIRDPQSRQAGQDGADTRQNRAQADQNGAPTDRSDDHDPRVLLLLAAGFFTGGAGTGAGVCWLRT